MIMIITMTTSNCQ